MRIAKLWCALLFIILLWSDKTSGSYPSLTDGDIESALAFQTTSPPSFLTLDPITGLFHFAGGLILNADGIRWRGIGGIASAFDFDSNNTFTLENSLHLKANTIVTSNNSAPGGAIMFDGSGSNHAIYLDGEDVLFAKPLRVSNIPLTLDGQGHTCTVRSGIYFDTRNSNGGTLTLTNMTLVTQNSSYMFTNTFTGASANPTLRNVTIRPIKGGPRYLFNGSGSNTGITIVGDVRIEGPGSVFNFGCNVTIAANSSLYIGPGVTVCGIGLGGIAGTPAVGITMTDSTSVLYLDGCDFYTGIYGVQIINGSVLLRNKVRIYNGNYPSFTANTALANGLVFGDGTAAHDVDVCVLGGGYIEAIGYIYYNHS